MAIACEHFRIGAESTSRDDNVGERQNSPRAVKPPGEIFGFMPHAMVHRHVHEEIEERCEGCTRASSNHATQNLATYDVATDELSRFESLRERSNRILSGAQQMDVNRGINEHHVVGDILLASQ